MFIVNVDVTDVDVTDVDVDVDVNVDDVNDIDRHLLQESVNVFVEMGFNYGSKKLKVYKTDLERPIIDHAGAYYRRQSAFWKEEDSSTTYLVMTIFPYNNKIT